VSRDFSDPDTGLRTTCFILGRRNDHDGQMWHYPAPSRYYGGALRSVLAYWNRFNYTSPAWIPSSETENPVLLRYKAYYSFSIIYRLGENKGRRCRVLLPRPSKTFEAYAVVLSRAKRAISRSPKRFKPSLGVVHLHHFGHHIAFHLAPSVSLRPTSLL
jgi:hypothetical protein